MGFNEMKCDFNSKSISDEVIEEYRNANNENHVMFRIFDKMLSENVDLNMNSTPNKHQKTVPKVNQTNDEYDLSCDLINQISSNERMIRSLVDIVCENFVTINELKVTEINLSHNLLVEDVNRFITQFRIKPFDVDYNIIVKTKQSINTLWNSPIEYNPPRVKILIFLVKTIAF